MAQETFAFFHHVHGENCYARTADGRPYAYTPCRADGLDRNLRNVNPVDAESMIRVDAYQQRRRPSEHAMRWTPKHGGLTLRCSLMKAVS
jgi:hypothetical protein